MAYPFFYLPDFTPGSRLLELEEETSKHIVQVLRMQAGEKLHLTDGKGHLLEAAIQEAHKKHCTVTILNETFSENKSRLSSIAVSLLKNTSRFEWFLEKATELGIREIIPLRCHRTEKEKFRQDRLTQICISAMLQSQQVWLPLLPEPVEFDQFIGAFSASQKWIAYCEEGEKPALETVMQKDESAVVLIGPEGDFSGEEIQMALDKGYSAVSLGENRLRTETAALKAAVLLSL